MKRLLGSLVAAALGAAIGCNHTASLAQPRVAVWMKPEPSQTGRPPSMVGREVFAERIGGSVSETLALLRSKDIQMDPGFGIAAAPEFNSVWAILASDKGPMQCTAVAVGPMTLLTAAHCVAEGERLRAIEAGVELVCHRHQDFREAKAQFEEVAKCQRGAPCPAALDLAWCSGPEGSRLPSGIAPVSSGPVALHRLLGADGCSALPPVKPLVATVQDAVGVGDKWESLQNHWLPYQGKLDGTSGLPTCKSDSGAPIFNLHGRVVAIHLGATNSSVAWAIAATAQTVERILRSVTNAKGVAPAVCGVGDSRPRSMVFKPPCE